MIIVVSLLGLLAALILVLVKLKRDQKTEQNIQHAAEVLFRYKGLESALNSDYSWNADTSRIFICIRWKDQGIKRYVFNPELGISIGYDPEHTKITILDPTVSAKHCMLFQQGSHVFVNDNQSTNGTIIKRGFKKMRVKTIAEIQDRDTLCLGNTEIKILIRTYQPQK